MKQMTNYRLKMQKILFVLMALILAGFHVASAQAATAGGAVTAEIVWAEPDGYNFPIYHSSFDGDGWTARQALTEGGGQMNTMPVIDAGTDGVIWAVWSSASGKSSHLYYCVFDERGWSRPKQIQSPLLSNTSPSILVDGENLPWVVWAGFDGQDDDIFFSRWNGSDWETPARVNRNDGEPDILPVLWVSADGSIRVKWSSYQEAEYLDYGAFWSGTGWSQEGELGGKDYRSLMEQVAQVSPNLPEFVKNPTLASMHVKMDDKKWAFRIQETMEATRGESGSPLQLSTSPDQVGQNVIIGFGDSITVGEPYVSFSGEGRRIGGYEPFLEALGKGTGWPIQVLNYGVGGESTRVGVSRISSVLARHRSKYVLILEGTNDFLYFGISLPSTIYNLRAMINWSRFYNAIPVIATLTPDTKSPEKNIAAYYPEIVNLASQEKIPLADQYAAMSPSWYALNYDGIHPNMDGYKVMASTWFKALPELSAVTLDATDVAESSVVFNGRVKPRGYPVRCFFEFGYDTNFGGKTTVVEVRPGNAEIPVSIGKDDLSENSTYYFRLVASNNYLTVKGNVLALKTLESPSKGCFIATAAFGSPLEGHVVTLRKFRDRFLVENAIGKKLVRWYYHHSPALARQIANSDALKSVVRSALYPVAWVCGLAVSAGLWSAASIVGIFLFVPLLLVAAFLRARKTKGR